MLEKHKKFAAYWEGIGRPKLEVYSTRGQWVDVVPGEPRFYQEDYRIKDDPHWELRREWIYSDVPFPIEYKDKNNNWRSVTCPSWDVGTLYRKAQQTEEKTMTKFKTGDKVKIVKKVTESKDWNNSWVFSMDKHIGAEDTIKEIKGDGVYLTDISLYGFPAESLELLPNDNEMPEESPHAALIDEYCKIWKVTDKPWKEWQYDPSSCGGNNWIDCEEHPLFCPLHNYRRKPKTININGHEVPMPLSVKPDIGQVYYIVKITSDSLFYGMKWANDADDNRFFERKICHLAAESAIIHGKALLSFMPA